MNKKNNNCPMNTDIREKLELFYKGYPSIAKKVQGFINDALAKQKLAWMQKVEGMKEKIELEEPRLFQPNPARNEMGGYSSCPFYCSLCGMGEMDIQDNKQEDGTYYCECSVWTSSCGGTWIKWKYGEEKAKEIMEKHYPSVYNQALTDVLETLKKEEYENKI
jgi:hypothetical protein